MSFSYNPYNHIDLIRAQHDDETKAIILANLMIKRDPLAGATDIPLMVLEAARTAVKIGVSVPTEALPPISMWQWHCHSCGADSEMTSTDLGALVHDFERHLAEGHHRTKADFEGWSDH